MPEEEFPGTEPDQLVTYGSDENNDSVYASIEPSSGPTNQNDDLMA